MSGTRVPRWTCGRCGARVRYWRTPDGWTWRVGGVLVCPECRTDHPGADEDETRTEQR